MAGTPTFRIDSTRAGTRGTLVATGELDSGTCVALIEAVERAASESGASELHLDLGGLSFIDSAGLRAMIQIELSSRERGLALVVTPPPAPVTELLELTGVADRLTLATHEGQTLRQRPFVERVELDLVSDLGAPSRARSEIRELAGALLDDDALDAAVLLTSELVANAVIHPPSGSDGSVGLRITSYEGAIRCEVTDHGSGFDPASLGRRVPETGGRGLMLVETLATRWGTGRPSEGSFCVWFELENGAADAAA